MLCVVVYCCYEQGLIRESENTKEQARKKEMTFEKKKIVNNNELHLYKDSCDKQIEKEKHSRN